MANEQEPFSNQFSNRVGYHLIHSMLGVVDYNDWTPFSWLSKIFYCEKCLILCVFNFCKQRENLQIRFFKSLEITTKGMMGNFNACPFPACESQAERGEAWL